MSVLHQKGRADTTPSQKAPWPSSPQAGGFSPCRCPGVIGKLLGRSPCSRQVLAVGDDLAQKQWDFLNSNFLHYSTKNLIELNNEFNKLAGYEINIQKSVALLFTNNQSSEREIKKMPFTTALQRIKYLRINLSKEAKVFYTLN